MFEIISGQPNPGTDQILKHLNFWASLLTGESPFWQSFGMTKLKKDKGTFLSVSGAVEDKWSCGLALFLDSMILAIAEAMNHDKYMQT